ncbi:MAG: PAS domain S-box protein [Undibacterium sp.]|nr:PAS domain S-box protein [Undibacterium sp.]
MIAANTQLRTISVVFYFFVCATVAGIVAQSWWAIKQDREVTLASEYEHGLIVVRLLEEHATQTVLEAERNFDNVVSTIFAAEKEAPLSDTVIRNILTKAQPFNRVMKALQFVNPKGEAWVSSIDYPAYQTDADDRTYIAYLLKHTNETTAIIGRPFQRFYDGELVVPIARNVISESGIYLGIISTDISISYFSSVYERVAKDSKAMVALFTNDGAIIVRFPFNPDQVGQDLSKSSIAQSLKTKPVEGMFEDAHFLDESHSIVRLYTYRKIKTYPITAIFSRETQAVLLPWQARTQTRIAFAAIITLLTCSLSFFLWRQFLRLHQSEKSLLVSQEHVKRSESKFTNLFEYSPVPLALLRADDYQILEINSSLLKLWGYSKDQVKDRTLAELNVWQHKKDADTHNAILEEDGSVNQFEVTMLDQYGDGITCQISSRRIETDGDKLLIFSPIDISRLREIESQIRNLNVQLEVKVSERTLSLANANTELEEALTTMKRMQDEMLRTEKMAALGFLVAGISHELNTPIGNSLMVASTLHFNTEALFNEMESGQPRKTKMLNLIAESRKGADILMRNLERAAQLITSFKQVAVDQTSDKYRSFDLKKTLEDVLSTLEPMYRRTSHQLFTDLAEDISMDSYPGALGQILTNFITNAITHGFELRENGAMYLTTKRADNDQVKIIFSDDGMGIPVDHISRVFDPFFTTKLGKGGSGLGLNIVYNLVTELLGGTISIDSKVGVGTRITLFIPLHAPVRD